MFTCDLFDPRGNLARQASIRVDGVWRHFIIERFKPYIESAGRPKP